jgi:hypothetical protein
MTTNWKTLLSYKHGDKLANLQSRAYYRIKIAQTHNKSLVPQIQKALENAKKYFNNKSKKHSTTKKMSHVGKTTTNKNASAFLTRAKYGTGTWR